MQKLEQPIINGSAWEFFLYINNQTSHTLTVDQKKLDWGVWYLDSTDKKAPIQVKPGESVQALGIRAAKGTATGYECRCRWSHKERNKTLYSIDLKIDVPFSSSNTSSLVAAGDIKVEGWKNIPKSGHNFTCSITVTEGNCIIEPEAALDSDEKSYVDLLMSNNELIQNWDKLQAGVTEKEQFNPMEEIPKEYLFPPKNIFICRSKANIIPKEDWEQLFDPIYEYTWQKEKHVAEYFSVAVHSVNTNPRNTVSIPIGMEVVQESSVEITSSIKNTLTTTMSIHTLLKGEYSGVSAELEANYSISDVLEKSTSRVEREGKTITIGQSDKNRLFVPWVFSTAVAVYRRKKDGTVSLAAVSEWANEILDKVYEY